MNSKWQANKIGLINFWYYDEQEFPFAKGRMLLRGSNGSGKSVTMQSVIPLLLDGNMSPERLDPFGSRDRKMSSYLLEEDDGREERTGYLYLEFKRQDSETYITIGMGIRARRGKPLDKWYFSLTDGRRIGKDFFLYKETDEKITLSKQELEYRVQSGGRLFERQADYMEYVNRQIFGFETIEEYKEMIDLLIQLRTPKLSKDFKPSVINDILSDSLQPLSEDDLRPMSEAIENMDNMNMNLKTMQEGKQAAEKINRVLHRYNQIILFEKATGFEENRKYLDALVKDEAGDRQRQADCEKRVEELKIQAEELDARREALEKEKESLTSSDALSLKAREVDLSGRIAQSEALLREKTAQLDAKQEQYIEIEGRRKEELDRAYQKEQELSELLDNMDSEAEDMAFEEHHLFRKELTEIFEASFDFDTHERQFDQTRTDIEAGLNILREVDSGQRQAEELMQKRDQHQRETDAAQRRVSELESMMTQVENEWKEALYSWNGSNQELILTRERLKELARFAEVYDGTSDFAQVRHVISDAWFEKKGRLDGELKQRQTAIELLREERKEQEKALAEWENHREPEPARSEAVERNRVRLREKKIPYQEFYKLLEFSQSLQKEDCDHLEEALLHMGILDALVIEERYREQVLAMDPGCADKYLFVQNQHAQRSLLDVLELNDEVNDIFSNPRITGILSNIAYDGEGGTAIAKDGTYQIGVIAGTITGQHEAGFLGTKAREQNRLAKMAACREEIERLSSELAALQQEEAHLKGRKACLEQEYQALPDDKDLREVYRMLEDASLMVERMKADGVEMEEELRALGDKLKALNKEALHLAEKLYLTASYQVFQKADNAARAYGQYFYQLKAGHQLYLQIIAHGRELEERMEKLDEDQEQIRYDMGNAERGLRKEREEHRSVSEQLAMTDYEEIKERLDACMEWLKSYPGLLQKCIEEKGQKEEQSKQLQRQLEEYKEKIADCSQKGEYLKRCFEAERDLGYVKLAEDDGEAVDAALVVQLLTSACQTLEKEQIIRNLNQVYFENRGYLNDYQLTQAELFDQLETEQQGYPSAKRLDITARYQGVKMPFHKLLIHLQEEIEALQELIKAGDRELFEDILGNTVSRKIRGKINSSNGWVNNMNRLMGSMNTSSGLKLSLRWRSRTAETEDQLDTNELVELLKKDYRLMGEAEAAKLSLHFRSKVEEARRHARDSGGTVSFYQVMKETLDYRKWFEFQLFAQKSGERQRELTNSVFGTFSGGEKAMSMYVPLFSAVMAKYQGGRPDAPRLISLDEAFAGVDNRNIRDMFRLMAEFQFDFIINSQVLWGDYDTLDALAIYQLLRPENAKFVTVMPYLWNGTVKEMLDDEGDMEERASAFA